MNWYKKAEQNIDSDTWFQGSKVVDQEGNLLKVYHGTNANFNQFDLDYCSMGIVWFSSNKNTILSGESGACGTSYIKEAYLNIQNPAGWSEYDKWGIGELIDRGYDGIILDDNYVVFNVNQIGVIE